MNFGQALEAIKQGKKIQRAGWNGLGMWVALQVGSKIDSSLARGGAAKQLADLGEVKEIVINPHLSIKNADNSISTWVPSVNDCIAEDWNVL